MQGITKHRKQLVFAKTTIFWRKQVILATLFIINAHNYLQWLKYWKVRLLTKFGFNPTKNDDFVTLLYIVFIDPQQVNCFTFEVYLFAYAQNKVKYLPSSNIPRVGDQIWRILVTFSNVRHVVFTKYKTCYKIIILCRIESKFGK